ncbi:RES domain-containing protein [Glaciihabitans tibetensis]|uniref:RES domain-containing protein n=1 Tax=Glaciihabitans tibetensis TaxID=1266600 RepID=A0A2T0VG79_9MICO|nr:RES domain-containing protein [Glaciihabitans tibetensis]
MSVPIPPTPFTAKERILAAGELLYRTHSIRFAAHEFNPGQGSRTRFAFFGDPIVPVLYTAAFEDAALCETILHDVPKSGGAIAPSKYGGRVCSRLVVQREIRLASLMGLGERALGIDAGAVCSTGARDYPQTVVWAEAAHLAGFDGLAYPSSKASGREAYVLFGDRVPGGSLAVDSTYQWSFDTVDGLRRLIVLGRSINVQVRLA